MIKSKTYNGQPGLNYIQASELALTTVYKVKREGLQYDRFVSGSANRTYTHDSTLGRIYFPQVFNTPGERVFVIYKESSSVQEPVPGICGAVGIVSTTLPSGIVNTPYLKSIQLTGTEPFNLIVNTNTSGMALTLSGSVVTLQGTPTSEGTKDIDFDVTNCDGASQNFNQSFEVLTDINFYVSNLSSPGMSITKIIPGLFTIKTGSFPVHYLQGITGVHAGFTQSLSVFISGVVFPFTLSLIKNGAVLQSFSVTVDDQYTFDEQTFLSTDQLQIVLN